jgi:membrane protein DedA with SNARE-associated domain
MTWLAQLVHRWGYLAIFIGTYLEGEAVLLSAGALCATGILTLPLVVVSAALGSFAWGQTWFRVGHISGRALIARRPSWQVRARVVERWLSRSGLSVLLLGRFIAGMGTLLPAMIGSSGYAWRRFSVLDAVGAVVWALAVTGAGCALGSGVRWASRSLSWVGLVALAVVATTLIALVYRQCARAVALRLAARSLEQRPAGRGPPA